MIDLDALTLCDLGVDGDIGRAGLAMEDEFELDFGAFIVVNNDSTHAVDIEVRLLVGTFVVSDFRGNDRINERQCVKNGIKDSAESLLQALAIVVDTLTKTCGSSYSECG